MLDRLNSYHLAVTIIGVCIGFIHRWHVSTLFENDRNFSHLSKLEREMSFRTEMGMYYSYFKKIAEAESFDDGMNKIVNDSTSEYGKVINAGSRYNILPEMIAGYLYHTIKGFGLMPIPQCWQVERDGGLPPVISCEGLGVPIYFYLEFVWLGAVITAAVLFYYSTYMWNSIWSGLITILLFFYNHNECTRVQWTPPLRESFAYPALLYQQFTIANILRKNFTNRSVWRIPTFDMVDAFCSTLFCLWCWQLSQYIFNTQIMALLILKWLRVIPRELYISLITIHTGAVLFIHLRGNSCLLSGSAYTCLVFVSTVFTITAGNGRTKMTFLEILIAVGCAIFARFFLGSNGEDLHIINLLKSKLSDYKDFHTLLYTCSPEFDFLRYKSYLVIIKTLLLPIAILAGILILYYWYRHFKIEGFPKCIEPNVAYTALQTGAFVVMAIFIMRLKLFMNPHLCIIAGAVCAKRYLGKVGIKSEMSRAAVVIVLILGMSYHGYEKLKEERSVLGEYRNIEQEELLEWINSNTNERASFAGTMSLMANVMLSTGRPVFNNPFYECKDMRGRTMMIYEIYSRKNIQSVYTTLTKLQVDYIILEEPLCLGSANLPPGCQMVDLWDVEDNGRAKAAGKPAVCPILFHQKPYPFKEVFSNNHYLVLQVLKPAKLVEYEPRPTSFLSHVQS